MNDTTSQGTTSWWQRLTGGLKRTSGALGATISDLVMRGPLTPERIEEIEDELIRADLGVEASASDRDRDGRGALSQS